MDARGRLTGRTVWRNAIAFVAAYLLVLQAALAGVAVQPMQAYEGHSFHVTCLNGDLTDPADRNSQPSPFDCCGLGCLVGSQTLQSPSSPDLTLSYPSARSFDPGREAQAPPTRSAAADGPRPRGPPATV